MHPERLEKAIVYPTGLVYYSLWNVVLKWFMEEHTRDKVVPAISLADVQAPVLVSVRSYHSVYTSVPRRAGKRSFIQLLRPDTCELCIVGYLSVYIDDIFK